MFSSKVIKTDEPEKSSVRNFYLQQFPDDDGDPQENGTGKPSGHVKTTVDAARLSAERIRVEAQQEANLLLQTAQKNVAQIELEACERGYKEGLQSGMAKGEGEYQILLQQLDSITAECKQLKEHFYEDHQDVIVDLALSIASKVIHQEVSLNRDIIIGVLKSAVKLAVERERLKIMVHPDDMQLCIQKRPGILKEIDGIQQIIFEADESVGRAGALIEYAYGEIDARIEQQFNEIASVLRQSQLDRDDANAGI